MSEVPIGIETANGIIDGFIYYPERAGQFPGILYISDIIGIRAEFRTWAAHLAEKGFVVLLPNVFYRVAKPPIFNMAFRTDDPQVHARIAELLPSQSPANVASDAAIYLDLLTKKSVVDSTSIGVVGHCLGGATAVRVAAAEPDRVKVAISLHGGFLYTDGPDSPHTLLPHINAKLYFGHATEDQTMPSEAIRGLEDALARWGGSYESELYEGARHGWTIAGGPAYHPAQSGRAFNKVVNVLQSAFGKV